MKKPKSAVVATAPSTGRRTAAMQAGSGAGAGRSMSDRAASTFPLMAGKLQMSGFSKPPEASPID